MLTGHKGRLRGNMGSLKCGPWETQQDCSILGLPKTLNKKRKSRCMPRKHLGPCCCHAENGDPAVTSRWTEEICSNRQGWMVLRGLDHRDIHLWMNNDTLRGQVQYTFDQSCEVAWHTNYGSHCGRKVEWLRDVGVMRFVVSFFHVLPLLPIRFNIKSLFI